MQLSQIYISAYIDNFFIVFRFNMYYWNAKIFRKNLLKRKKIIMNSLRKPKPWELINDYTSQCSVHGLRYISNTKAPILEKSFWLTAVLLCTVAACLLVNQLWKRYRGLPTVLVVKDTHVPLYLFPFPSITICPSNKVKKSAAIAYFSRFVNVSDEKLSAKLTDVMSALSMMQQPTYFRMKPHIQNSYNLLPLLKNINITDFMLEVLPKCTELFAVCNWHGERVNCCDVFSLQRTEEGFCYSFNSLTSEDGKHCPLSEVLENEGIVEEDDIMYEGCQLRRNTAVGTVTGLEMFMMKSNESETLRYGQKDLNGVRMIIHTSYEYPNAGDGIWIREEHGKRVSITTFPFITVTSEAVKQLDVRSRGCVFPDEKELHVYHVYTESSCLIECRLKFIASKCNCYMYYFPPFDNKKPICGTLHLECILEYSRFLRHQRPPDNTPGFDMDGMQRALNCSNCIHTCYETEHDIEISIVSDSQWLSRVYYGHIDVAYGNLGATKYRRDLTFTWTDLLVSLGGIANLFLGFSLLSVIEFIYWILKIILLMVWRNYKRRKKLAKLLPLIIPK